MFSKSIPVSPFSIPSPTQLLHFLRLHQVVYQLTLVICILLFHPNISLFQILSVSILILLITPTFLLLQDVLGKKDDAIAGQKRIFFSPQFNRRFFYTSLGLMLCIFILNNLSSVFCFVLLLLSTIGYAASKHFRFMFTSYTFRWMSSICTFLMYIFILVGSFTDQFIYITLFISIFDLVGNIAGDLRDKVKDSNAGIKTLVSYYGVKRTVNWMICLETIAFAIVVFGYNNTGLFCIFMFNILVFFPITIIPDRYIHGVFHISKLLSYLTIAFVICHISFILFGVLFVFIFFTWFIAYYFYLQDGAPRLPNIIPDSLIFKG